MEEEQKEEVLEPAPDFVEEEGGAAQAEAEASPQEDEAVA